MIVVIPDSLDGERVDRVLAMLADVSRAKASASIDAGEVLLDGEIVQSRSLACKTGQVLEATFTDILKPLVPNASVRFETLYEDDHILVINKPAGVVVHPGAGTRQPTLIEGLLTCYPDIANAFPDDHIRPGIVHRLDAGTSGALIVARSRGAYDELLNMMKSREIHREYRALVWGIIAQDVGTIDAPIGRSVRRRTKLAIRSDGKHARTHYRLLARCEVPAVSYVAVTLETGRTHQIRVHFGAIGHAVVGDATYNGVRTAIALDRPFLHATGLQFVHPITKVSLTIRASLPDELAGVLEGVGVSASEQ